MVRLYLVRVLAVIYMAACAAGMILGYYLGNRRINPRSCWRLAHPHRDGSHTPPKAWKPPSMASLSMVLSPGWSEGDRRLLGCAEILGPPSAALGAEPGAQRVRVIALPAAPDPHLPQGDHRQTNTRTS